MALMNEDICKVGQELMQTTEQLIDEMISDTTSILTVYYGEEATQQQAEELQQYIEEKYPEVEVEIQEGGQPLYYFLLSAE